MRLFAAIAPPTFALDHLAAALGPARDAKPDSGALRWVSVQLWHLTLAFFGEVAEERRSELEARLARVAARHAQMELHFAGAGAFSRPTQASVLWVGVGGPTETLAALAASCGAAGRRIGLEIEERRYRPHLTLARPKGRRPVDVRPVVTVLQGYRGPSWTASEVLLVRSHLGPRPRHETLAGWPLRSSGYQA